MKEYTQHRQDEVATLKLENAALRDALESLKPTIAAYERIVDGLPQDAIDGGWCAKGIEAYAKRLEVSLDCIIESCISCCEQAMPSEIMGHERFIRYNRAIDDCIEAIRALKSTEETKGNK